MNAQQMTDEWNVVIATEVDAAYVLGAEHYGVGQFSPPKGLEEYLAYMRGQYEGAKRQNAINAADYDAGINLYRNGATLAACMNKAQRYGWRDAQTDARVVATDKFCAMIQAMMGDEAEVYVNENDCDYTLPSIQ